ncbi:predicted protein [Arabidopsis lyrata subsp. lyrata]|uniref:Predicted protein n=1 Tax=Arabidopsis lyrata subsp. lyrata TaxID=81972 RepID=D7MI41_ARALL|nr:predicted protein [Arabidopsis lyrata subsp. lyrata]
MAWIIWKIRKQRNELVYENVQDDLNVLIHKAGEDSALWDSQSQLTKSLMVK